MASRDPAFAPRRMFAVLLLIAMLSFQAPMPGSAPLRATVVLEYVLVPAPRRVTRRQRRRAQPHPCFLSSF